MVGAAALVNEKSLLIQKGWSLCSLVLQAMFQHLDVVRV